MNSNFFTNLPQDTKLSYAEIIAQTLKDQYIEIFMGDVYENVKQADFETNTFAIVYGKVIAGYGDCLLLNSLYYDEMNKDLREGNLIFINTFSVKTISVFDDKGSLHNSIIGSRHMRKYQRIKKIVNKK